ncbi:hypothetical protein AKG08_17305 [Achromobacter piechaudii]|uniref:hypothetical protein n=1 Tax=Achromobacter piechaudii TaxID=72556 RepID=UPI0006822156|nr:hypothetical protein [Achromobacter piechaudii]KNY09404.1 hypothetical protein AKG08_17305 [Achromobacter piechaudii]
MVLFSGSERATAVLAIGLLLLSMQGCGNGQQSRSASNETTEFSTVVLPVVVGGKDKFEMAADTNALATAFKSAGFNAIIESGAGSKAQVSGRTIYVNAMAGGNEYCLEALVREERGSERLWQFELRQYKVVGGMVLNRDRCATEFVASLKRELGRRAR